MKHKTWFRLVLKAIGIYLLASAMPNLVNHTYFILSRLFTDHQVAGAAGMWPDDNYWLPQVLYWVTQFGVGLYLLHGGRWLVTLCIPSNRPYCVDCGYNLSHAHGECCPECGAGFPQNG